jgi:uncharacterized protein (TIGR03437 family)
MPAGAQYAIGIRQGGPFSTSTFNNTWGGTVGENPVTVTRQSSPPLTAGTYYIAVLIVTSSAGQGTVTATITAGASTIAVDAALDFGSVTVGQRRDLPLNIRNTGADTLRVASMTSSNAQFKVTGTIPPFELGAGAQRAVTVRFEPTAAGAQTATLTIASNDASRPNATVSLTGTGASGVSLSASTASLAFAAQTGTHPAPLPFTARNTGAGTVAVRAASTQSWLTVSPATAPVGNDPVTFTAAVNAGELAGGTHNAEIRLTPDQGAALTVTVRLTLTDITSVSAATYLAGPVAPDSIVSVFGQALAPGVEVAASTTLPETLLGTSVTVRDSAGVERRSGLFFVAATQINYLMPAGTAAGRATVTVTSGRTVAGRGTVEVAPVAPALFTANLDGKGVAAAYYIAVRGGAVQDQVLVYAPGCAPPNCRPAPIDPGAPGDETYLLLFGSGIRGRSRPEAVTATVGGVAAEVLGAVAQGQYPGLDQVNLKLPPGLSGRGEVEIVLTVEGRAANKVTVSVGGPPPPEPETPRNMPIRTGMTWDYKVVFPAEARLPYQPVFEVPRGLGCASGFCGVGTWPAGETAFQVKVLGTTTNAEFPQGWNVDLGTTGFRFFFFVGNQAGREPNWAELRVREVSGRQQLEVVGNVPLSGSTWRLLRALAAPTSAQLADLQTVTVEAGQFRDVVKTSVVIDGMSPYLVGQYVTDVWLAPEVGIIKMEGKNPQGTRLYTMELVRITGGK